MSQEAGQVFSYSHLLKNFPQFVVIPCGSAGKESTCNAGDLGSTPGLGRCTGEGKGYPLQYSGLENSMDCVVLGVAKSRTGLSDFRFLLVRGFGVVNKADVFLELSPDIIKL